MRIITETLWEDNENLTYTAYLQDNSLEIEDGRKRPAIIVCGGGAYMGISDREKEPVALAFLAKGYQAFVIEYTTKLNGEPIYPIPVFDLAKMVLAVRENAAQWNVDPDKICAVGFSAGGHLVASLSTQWHEDYMREKFGVPSEKLKLNAAVLCYPLTDYLLQREYLSKDKAKDEFTASMPGPKTAITAMFEQISVGVNLTEEMLKNASPYRHITKNAPPTFIWQTSTDELVYMEQNLFYAMKLKEHYVPFELHIFQSGVHGMSLATEQSGSGDDFIDRDVSKWFNLAIRFLDKNLNKNK
ncbi:MAG: alpha/beta hydrolase [Clostridiales bacterium]|jgi:acetyl esterase/lipase|nr:alpha/beta hydrolase [Clostridiales bacterium]